MRFIYILIVVIISIVSIPSEIFAQEAKDNTHIIFIKDFSAEDYYSLVKTSSEIRIFTIEEACIPLGLLAISYEKGYGEKQSRDYTQAVILKLISRNASYTLYTLEDLRTACGEYRKDNSDD